LVVTSVVLGIEATAGTTVTRSSHNGLGAELGAAAAGLRTSRNSRPAGQLAINGASKSVARRELHIVRATTAAVRCSDDNRTGAFLGASAAGGRARSPGRKARKLAVNRASESVAGCGGSKSGATSTAEAGGSDNRTSLGLGASTARLSAHTVAGPTRNLAINGAGLGVAHALFLGGAFVTTVGGGNVNLVVARLVTGAAGLGAGSPGVPGVLAVNGARVSVAALFR
jgi:hypothetical protein